MLESEHPSDVFLYDWLLRWLLQNILFIDLLEFNGLMADDFSAIFEMLADDFVFWLGPFTFDVFLDLPLIDL